MRCASCVTNGFMLQLVKGSVSDDCIVDVLVVIRALIMSMIQFLYGMAS